MNIVNIFNLHVIIPCGWWFTVPYSACYSAVHKPKQNNATNTRLSQRPSVLGQIWPATSTRSWAMSVALVLMNVPVRITSVYLIPECAKTTNLMASSTATSAEPPRCCRNGNFRPMQCRRGLCRCVDADGRQVGTEASDVRRLSCYTADWRDCWCRSISL